MPTSLSRLGLLNERWRRSKRVAWKLVIVIPFSARAGLCQFLDALVNHRQRPRAEHVSFERVNGQQIDPGLRIESGR